MGFETYQQSGVPHQPQKYDHDPHAAYETPYSEDGPGPMAPHDEEFYEDAPPPRRRAGVLAIAAVLALAVVGTAGAFGYRAVFGHAGALGPPPVIKASTEPTKIVPPPQSNEGSSKLIYDRIGDRSQNEQIVPREEKPIDIQAATVPSGSFPSAVTPPAGDTSSINALLGTPPAATGRNGDEPKRVQTVPIRPDSTQGIDPARPAAAAGAPKRAAGLNPANATASRSPSGNTPLSLNPNEANASVPRRAAPTSRVATSTDAVASGSYVQVSSQRSESSAQASFRAMQSKYPDVLGNRPVVIRRADLGAKGVYYRAQVGPFGTVDEAAQLCSSLKTAGGQCVVQRN